MLGNSLNPIQSTTIQINSKRNKSHRYRRYTSPIKLIRVPTRRAKSSRLADPSSNQDYSERNHSGHTGATPVVTILDNPSLLLSKLSGPSPNSTFTLRLSPKLSGSSLNGTFFNAPTLRLTDHHYTVRCQSGLPETTFHSSPALSDPHHNYPVRIASPRSYTSLHPTFLTLTHRCSSLPHFTHRSKSDLIYSLRNLPNQFFTRQDIT